MQQHNPVICGLYLICCIAAAAFEAQKLSVDVLSSCSAQARRVDQDMTRAIGMSSLQ